MFALNLPENTILPVELHTFTPNENLIMILVGFHAINVMKENFIHQNSNDLIDQYEIKLKRKEDETAFMKNIYENNLISEKEMEKERNHLYYRDRIQSYENEISSFVKQIVDSDFKISSIEKDLLKAKEFQIHINTINELRIENELSIRTKKFLDLHYIEINKYKDLLNDAEKKYIMNENNEIRIENEMSIRTKKILDLHYIEISKYKDLLNDAEKINIINENNIKFQENEKIQFMQRDLLETKDLINKLLLEKEQNKNTLLQDRINTNDKSMQEITSLLKIQTNKSNVRGVEGETFFLQLALKTFCDCSNFEIIEKAKSPHSGDFWLKFDKFTIMVDSKNYVDTPVPLRDRVKLKDDILFHKKNIKIAWLVSMDQPILTFSGYPFMIDIEDGICYCYINSLMKNENPQNLLRMAWYSCNFVYDHLLNIDNEINLIGKYQKNESRIKNILNRMTIQSKERFTMIQQLTENFKLSEIDIRDCLNNEIRDVREQHIHIIGQWFSKNVIKKEGGKIKSTDMHKKFISDGENKNHGIDADMFKQILRCIQELDENDILRGKTDKAMYTIVNYSFLN